MIEQLESEQLESDEEEEEEQTLPTRPSLLLELSEDQPSSPERSNLLWKLKSK